MDQCRKNGVSSLVNRPQLVNIIQCISSSGGEMSKPQTVPLNLMMKYIDGCKMGIQDVEEEIKDRN